MAATSSNGDSCVKQQLQVKKNKMGEKGKELALRLCSEGLLLQDREEH